MTLFDNNDHLMMMMLLLLMMLMIDRYTYVTCVVGGGGYRDGCYDGAFFRFGGREWWPWKVGLRFGSPTVLWIGSSHSMRIKSPFNVFFWNCGENMEVLLGDGSWLCNKHQNQFTRNKEGSQNNCGDSQSNCLSGMQFIFGSFTCFKCFWSAGHFGFEVLQSSVC